MLIIAINVPIERIANVKQISKIIMISVIESIEIIKDLIIVIFDKLINDEQFCHHPVVATFRLPLVETLGIPTNCYLGGACGQSKVIPGFFVLCPLHQAVRPFGETGLDNAPLRRGSLIGNRVSS